MATDTIEYEDTSGIWRVFTPSASGNDISPFIATAATTQFSAQSFVNLRTRPLNFRIRDFKEDISVDGDDTFSNVVPVMLLPGPNPPATMPGDGDEMAMPTPPRQ